MLPLFPCPMMGRDRVTDATIQGAAKASWHSFRSADKVSTASSYSEADLD